MSWSTYKSRLARERDKDARYWHDEIGPLLASIADSATKAGESKDFDDLESWLDDIETETRALRAALTLRDRALASEGGP